MASPIARCRRRYAVHVELELPSACLRLVPRAGKVALAVVELLRDARNVLRAPALSGPFDAGVAVLGITVVTELEAGRDGHGVGLDEAGAVGEGARAGRAWGEGGFIVAAVVGVGAGVVGVDADLSVVVGGGGAKAAQGRGEEDYVMGLHRAGELVKWEAV